VLFTKRKYFQPTINPIKKKEKKHKTVFSVKLLNTIYELLLFRDDERLNYAFFIKKFNPFRVSFPSSIIKIQILFASSVAFSAL